MTFTHDDIRDRLVDYLYGQLDGDARAAYQAHLGACAACRDEVTGAERARAVAREVVRRPLADPVPERARARAFEAARAAVAARALAGPTQAGMAAHQAAAAAQAEATDARGAASSAGQGWFGRLRRRWTWTFPTFATVAAVAVFLLVRVTIFREAKSPVSAERLQELAKPDVATAPAPVPGQPSAGVYGVKARGPAPARDVERPADDEPQAQAPAAAVPPGDGAARPHRHRPPATGGARHDKQPQLDSLSSAASARGAGAPVAPPARMKNPAKASLPDGMFDRAIDEDRARARRDEEREELNAAPPVQNAKPKAARAVQAEELRRAPAEPRRDFAVPPPPAAMAPASAAKGNTAAQDDVEGAPAPAASEKKTSKKRKEPVSLPVPETRAKDRAADEAPGASAGAAAPDPALVRGSRAESLMNQRRWADAITILRDLLRRYPSHPAAPRWRVLLDAARAGLNAPEQTFATPPPPR